MLRADYDLEQGQFSESIVAGTTCGELPFFSDTPRTATVVAEKRSTAWVLDEKNWQKLQKDYPEVAYELMRICLKLTSERLSAITGYAFPFDWISDRVTWLTLHLKLHPDHSWMKIVGKHVEKRKVLMFGSLVLHCWSCLIFLSYF